MANASKKSKFHPLERLDKIDIEALQDFAHNAADNYVGGLVGVTGLLNAPSSISVNNTTELIDIGDCSWLGWNLHHEGLGGSKYSAFYGYYNQVDTRHGDISFDTVRAAVQSYYNTNGSLPDTPLGDNYDPATHGFAYPYVYALTNMVDAEIEPRRFWSTANGNETTQNVATQRQQVHSFQLVAREDAAPAGGDFPAIKILRLVSWEVNAGVVDLLTVVPVQLADSILNIYPRHVDAYGNPFVPLNMDGKEGLAGTIAWLKQRQDAIVEGGFHDLPLTIQEGNFTIPRFSLHGLEKYLGDRITDLEEKVQRACCIVKSRYNKPNGTNEVTVHNFADNDFNPLAMRDYSMALDNTSNGNTLFSPNFDPIADVTTIMDAEKIAGSVHINIPNQYEGWGMQVNLTTIFPTHHFGYIKDGQKAISAPMSISDKRDYDGQWVLNPGIGHTEQASGGVQAWANRMNTVSGGTSLMIDGNTRASNGDLGFTITHPIAYNTDGTTADSNVAVLNNNDQYITLYVKVDITLIRP